MFNYLKGRSLYCLRQQKRLEEKLGKAVIVKLFKLINLGTITLQHLKKFSYQQNMNVFTTFDNREIKERIQVTMERMAHNERRMGSTHFRNVTVQFWVHSYP